MPSPAPVIIAGALVDDHPVVGCALLQRPGPCLPERLLRRLATLCPGPLHFGLEDGHVSCELPCQLTHDGHCVSCKENVSAMNTNCLTKHGHEHANHNKSRADWNPIAAGELADWIPSRFKSRADWNPIAAGKLADWIPSRFKSRADWNPIAAGKLPD